MQTLSNFVCIICLHFIAFYVITCYNIIIYSSFAFFTRLFIDLSCVLHTAFSILFVILDERRYIFMEQNQTNAKVERKFLVYTPDILLLSNSFILKKIAITQTFLTNDNGDCHVRKETSDGVTRYYYARKGCDRKHGWRLILENEEISEEKYNKLIATRPHKKAAVINKMRYVFRYREQIFNIDVFDDEIKNPNFIPNLEEDDNANLEYLVSRFQCIIMIELEHPDEYVEVPRNFILIKEITNDLDFTTKALAKLLKKNN